MDNAKRSCAISYEGAAAFLLRLSLGVLFFMAGFGKFMAPGPVAEISDKMMESFAETFLPSGLTWLFLVVLPYLELALGAILIVGLFVRESLIVCGLLLLSLSFGKMVQGDHATVAQNMNYVFMTGVALWFSARDNVYSLDYLMGRRH